MHLILTSGKIESEVLRKPLLCIGKPKWASTIVKLIDIRLK